MHFFLLGVFNLVEDIWYNLFQLVHYVNSIIHVDCAIESMIYFHMIGLEMPDFNEKLHLTSFVNFKKLQFLFLVQKTKLLYS